VGNSLIFQHSPSRGGSLRPQTSNRSEHQLFYLIALTRIRTRDLWLWYHIELHAPTCLTQKLKLMGRGRQFTYILTINNNSYAASVTVLIEAKFGLWVGSCLFSTKICLRCIWTDVLNSQHSLFSSFRMFLVTLTIPIGCLPFGMLYRTIINSVLNITCSVFSVSHIQSFASEWPLRSLDLS